MGHQRLALAALLGGIQRRVVQHLVDLRQQRRLPLHLGFQLANALQLPPAPEAKQQQHAQQQPRHRPQPARLHH